MDAFTVKRRMAGMEPFANMEACLHFARGILIEFQTDYRLERKAFALLAAEQPQQAVANSHEVVKRHYESEIVNRYITILSSDGASGTLEENLRQLHKTTIEQLVVGMPWRCASSSGDRLVGEARASALANVAQVALVLADAVAFYTKRKVLN